MITTIIKRFLIACYYRLVSILRLLQRIHDDEEIEDWDKCLETLSKDLFNKNLDELGVTA